MTNHSGMKLGRRAAVHDPRTLQLANYVSSELTPPAKVNWGTKLTHLGMMMNDTLGDCTCAAMGHMIQAWTANNGSQLIVPDSAVLKAYEGSCGYNPNDPSTDQGGIETTVLNYCRKTGIAGHKIFGYVALEPGNRQHVELAVDLLGGCYLGVSLPLSAQTQKTWSVPPGGAHGNGAPGSWGGHAVPVVAYDSHSVTVVTWGKLLKMTWAFFKIYVEEAYGVLSTDWATGTKVAPSGFDFTQLQADLKLITG
jgi:hypothetical protein